MRHDVAGGVQVVCRWWSRGKGDFLRHPWRFHSANLDYAVLQCAHLVVDGLKTVFAYRVVNRA